MPKVIDFGIAKATESRLTDKTLFTKFHQFVGTPAYMSPEQAEMSGLDVDTRSDVYSLGVLVYELLTGSTPFSSKELLEAGYERIRQVIREEEPQIPSTRLNTLSAEGLSVVAKHRRLPPGTLSAQVSGELDWIVMKALEKDRTRRYQSASELASDIQRHLDNEPVGAGPPNRIYRLRKFLSKHRAPVLVSGLVLLSLVAGLVLATYGVLKANREAAKARTVTRLLNDMFRSADLDEGKSRDYPVRLLLDRFSRENADQLAEEPEVEMTLRQTIGSAYSVLGDYLQAEPHLRRARMLAEQEYGKDSPQAAAAIADFGWMLHGMGLSDDARGMLDQALAIQIRRYGRNHPASIRSITYLAALEEKVGNLNEAEALALEVINRPPRSC